MSIPTSLVIVLLVAAWLVVLVPMVARRREVVVESDEDSAHFRVLRRRGGRTRRGPRFRRRINDDASEIDGMDRDLDGEYTEDEMDEEAAVRERAEQDQLDDELLDDRYDVENLDDADDGGDADDTGQAFQPVVPDSRGADRVRVVQPHRSRPRRGFGSRPYNASDSADGPGRLTDSVQDAPADLDEGDLRTAGSHPYRDADFDARAVEDHDESYPADEPDADQRYRPVPRRPGRGGFDPDAAELARAYRYSRRRRVTLFLALMTVAFTLGAALLGISTLWAGTAVFGLLMVGYLFYLRRQVKIEDDIRQRRLAKLRRARQIRPEYHERAYQDDVAAQAHPYAARLPSQTSEDRARADRGFGRTVVDVEDDDPGFEDLEYYHPVTYRRAAGQ